MSVEEDSIVARLTKNVEVFIKLCSERCKKDERAYYQKVVRELAKVKG